MNWTVPEAQHYARQGQLETWIHAYLNSGDWANPALSQGLRLQPRWWRGPLELSLDHPTRCSGPEAHMEFVLPQSSWQRYVTEIANGLTDPLKLPPLIAQYRQGELSIRDGNHRHEALRQRGYTTAWVIIWFDSAADYATFKGVSGR